MFAAPVARRWWTLLIVAVLLAGLPCFGDCTLQALTPHHVPPCHQHQQPASGQHSDCEYQKLGVSQALELPVMALGSAPVEVEALLLAAFSAPVRTVIESPPPFALPSILRI